MVTAASIDVLQEISVREVNYIQVPEDSWGNRLKMMPSQQAQGNNLESARAKLGANGPVANSDRVERALGGAGNAHRESR